MCWGVYEKNNQYVPDVRIDQGSEISGDIWINIWPRLCIGFGRITITTDQINYSLEPFFPRNSYEGEVKDLKGSTFYLILPIDFGDQIKNYKFTFVINDIVG